MSSAGQTAGLATDPANDLLWRFDPRRLSAEEVRDTILAINGSLNRQTYGPSFYPSLSREVLAGQSRPGAGWGNSSEQEKNRRSVYIHVKRSLLTPILTAFDFPDPDLTCEDRFVTLQPGQALALLNSKFAHEQAKRLTASVGGVDLENEEFVQRVIAKALSREATKTEVANGSKLITTLQTTDNLPRQRAVELYCLTVMNWNEFLFVD
jgi:hypothetical protein